MKKSVREGSFCFLRNLKGSCKSVNLFLDTLSRLYAARCAVVNHGLSGPEMIVMDYSILHIYNIDADEWRNVQPLNVVST